MPAKAEAVEQLAASYRNDELGEIVVILNEETVIFDFGEFTNEVTTKMNPDGSLSFASISPGRAGFEFIVGDGQTLILRDAQHAYIFAAK